MGYQSPLPVLCLQCLRVHGVLRRVLHNTIAVAGEVKALAVTCHLTALSSTVGPAFSFAEVHQ
jgi:hypothetical protein